MERITRTWPLDGKKSSRALQRSVGVKEVGSGAEGRGRSSINNPPHAVRPQDRRVLYMETSPTDVIESGREKSRRTDSGVPWSGTAGKATLPPFLRQEKLKKTRGETKDLSFPETAASREPTLEPQLQVQHKAGLLNTQFTTSAPTCKTFGLV